VLAPHIFVEDATVAGVAAARRNYETTDLRQRLGRYHGDPDGAFWRWHDRWVDPAFRTWNIEALLPAIRCPLLAIQGEDDEYATIA
jgi:pimeloyl-ACP methyl ester carboxylesterase